MNYEKRGYWETNPQITYLLQISKEHEGTEDPENSRNAIDNAENIDDDFSVGHYSKYKFVFLFLLFSNIYLNKIIRIFNNLLDD